MPILTSWILWILLRINLKDSKRKIRHTKKEKRSIELENWQMMSRTISLYLTICLLDNLNSKTKILRHQD